MLKAYPCREEETLIGPITAELDRPWMEASENHTAFFTLFSKLRTLDAEVDKAAAARGVPEEEVGKVFVSYDCGRAVYAVYDWFHEPYQAEAVRTLRLARSHGMDRAKNR